MFGPFVFTWRHVHIVRPAAIPRVSISVRGELRRIVRPAAAWVGRPLDATEVVVACCLKVCITALRTPGGVERAEAASSFAHGFLLGMLFPELWFHPWFSNALWAGGLPVPVFAAATVVLIFTPIPVVVHLVVVFSTARLVFWDWLPACFSSRTARIISAWRRFRVTSSLLSGAFSSWPFSQLISIAIIAFWSVANVIGLVTVTILLVVKRHIARFSASRSFALGSTFRLIASPPKSHFNSTQQQEQKKNKKYLNKKNTYSFLLNVCIWVGTYIWVFFYQTFIFIFKININLWSKSLKEIPLLTYNRRAFNFNLKCLVSLFVGYGSIQGFPKINFRSKFYGNVFQYTTNLAIIWNSTQCVCCI